MSPSRVVADVKEVRRCRASGSDGRRQSREELEEQVRYLEAEIHDLRHRLTEAPGGGPRSLELRLADAQRSLAAVTAQNERLAGTLREARDQILKLKEEVDRLAQPPAGFGTFLQRNEDDSVDVHTGGRKLRVSVSPNVDLDQLRPWPGGHAQRGAQRRRRVRLRDGRRGRDVQGAARRRRPRAGHRQRRRGARRTPRGAAARRDAPRRRLAAARRARRLRLRAGAEVGGRGAGPRRGPRHRPTRPSAVWATRSR